MNLAFPIRFFRTIALALPFFLMNIMAHSASAQLTVEGYKGKTVAISMQDLKQLPRQSVTVTDPKTKATQTYEGVLLSSLLAKADAPTGKTLHGIEFRDYVEVSASDNYRVIFSLAELDPPTHANRVLLADTVDGKMLDSTQGPFKLISPDDIRPERWVRMVTKVSIKQVP